MRLFLVTLLSIVFSLNAAFAAVSGVCDAMDHFPQGDSDKHLHVGHLSHGVSEVMTDEHMNGDQETSQAKKPIGGHCHAHSATIVALTTSDFVLSPNFGNHVLIALPATPFISFIPAGLDRPPRDPLA